MLVTGSGPEVQADAEVQIKQFGGGLYAVTRCQGVETITDTWKQLVAWLAASPYRQAHHQWLEEMDGNGQLIALLYAIQ